MNYARLECNNITSEIKARDRERPQSCRRLYVVVSPRYMILVTFKLHTLHSELRKLVYFSLIMYLYILYPLVLPDNVCIRTELTLSDTIQHISFIDLDFVHNHAIISLIYFSPSP